MFVLLERNQSRLCLILKLIIYTCMDMLPLVYLEKKCMYIYKVCLHELHSLTDVYLLEEEELTKKNNACTLFFYCFFDLCYI